MSREILSSEFKVKTLNKTTQQLMRSCSKNLDRLLLQKLADFLPIQSLEFKKFGKKIVQKPHE